MLDPIKFAYLLHSINFVFSTVNFTENCNSIIFSDLIENHYEAHETITVISEEGFDESLSLANPFMIMNIEKSILSKTLYFNNYVILLKNSSIIEKLLRNLSETNLWNPFVSPLAKYLIIVQNSNQSSEYQISYDIILVTSYFSFYLKLNINTMSELELKMRSAEVYFPPYLYKISLALLLSIIIIIIIFLMTRSALESKYLES